MDELLLKSFLTLIGIILALAATLYMVRRYASAQMTRNGAAQFRIVGHIALHPKRSVYLILVADKILVVGATDGAVSTLSEITDPETVKNLTESSVGLLPFYSQKFSAEANSSTARNAPAPSFGEFLKSLGKKADT